MQDDMGGLFHCAGNPKSVTRMWRRDLVESERRITIGLVMKGSQENWFWVQQPLPLEVHNESLTTVTPDARAVVHKTLTHDSEVRST